MVKGLASKENEVVHACFSGLACSPPSQIMPKRRGNGFARTVHVRAGFLLLKLTIDDNLLLKFDESTIAEAEIESVPIIEIKTHASKSFQNLTLFVRTTVF